MEQERHSFYQTWLLPAVIMAMTAKKINLKKVLGNLSVTSPFQKIVVISYSAFDTFPIPESRMEKQKLRKDGDIFGYVYCGLRESLNGKTSTVQQYRLQTPGK